MLQQALHPFLDAPLLGAEPTGWIAPVLELLLHGELALRQPAGLGQRLIDGGHDLLLPLLLQALPLLLKLIPQRIERLLGLLPMLLRPWALALLTRRGRLFHLPAGLLGLRARRLDALLPCGVVHLLGEPVYGRCQRVRALRQLALRLGGPDAVSGR